MMIGVGIALVVGVLIGRSFAGDESSNEDAVTDSAPQVVVGTESTEMPAAAVSIDDAKALIEQGSLDEAESMLTEILKVDSGNQVVMYNLGVIATQRGDAAVAIEWYTKAIAIESGMHSAVYNRGLAHLALGDSVKAISDLERAASIAPEWAKGRYYLGKAYVAGGQADKGQKLMTEAQAADPSLAG